MHVANRTHRAAIPQLHQRILNFRCVQNGARLERVRTRSLSCQRGVPKHVCQKILLPVISKNGNFCEILGRRYLNFAVYSGTKNTNEEIENTNSSTTSNSDNDLFREVISRFKNLEKNPKSDDIVDVTSKSENLVKKFLGLASLPHVKDKMMENLNSILNFYEVLDLSREFEELLSQMNALLIANETTYFIYIRHHMKTNPWGDGLKIVESMKKNRIEIHARTYYHIILNAVRAGDIGDALEMMQEMKGLQNVFHDHFYSSLFEIALANPRGMHSIVYSALDLLKDTGFILGPRSFGSLRQWFEREKQTWKVGTSLINIRGICKCCGAQLKKFTLPEQQRTNLQESLRNIAKAAILNNNGIAQRSKLPMFTSDSKNDKGMKVQALQHYIESNGPFDIALDVLNAAYVRHRGFNSFQVKRIVRHFKALGKHVLALCSSPLLSTLLEVEAAPNLPNYHMIQLLHYLRRQNCGIFFVDDTKEEGHIDDHFVLLSMVFQKMNIDIVTADKFGDHVDSLDIFTRRDFARWMKAHQIVLQKFTDTGNPIFRRKENFDTDVQSTGKSWHIPGPNRQWLCCNRT